MIIDASVSYRDTVTRSGRGGGGEYSRSIPLPARGPMHFLPTLSLSTYSPLSLSLSIPRVEKENKNKNIRKRIFRL